MRTFYLTLVVLVGLLFVACTQPALKSEGTANPNFAVETLFQKDSYTVYRFYDNGRYLYLVTPSGSVVNSRTVSCGKSCGTEESEQINTVAPAAGATATPTPKNK